MLKPRLKLVALTAAAAASLAIAGPSHADLVCAPMNASTANNRLAGKWEFDIPQLGRCQLNIDRFGAVTASNCKAGVALKGSLIVATNCRATGNLTVAINGNDYPGPIAGALTQPSPATVASIVEGRLTFGGGYYPFAMIQTR